VRGLNQEIDYMDHELLLARSSYSHIWSFEVEL